MRLWFPAGSTLDDVPRGKYIAMHAMISLAPLLFSMFLPGQIGMIITLLSGVAGFMMIYIVPVFAYLKIMKLEIEYPLLAAALRQNEVKFFLPGVDTSMKQIPVRRSFNDSTG